MVDRTFPSPDVAEPPSWVSWPDPRDPSFTLQDPHSGVGIRVALLDVEPGSSMQVRSARVYASVLPPFGNRAAHVLVRPRNDGIEDFLVVSDPASPTSLRIHVGFTAPNVGLRLVENVLEVLDLHGAPRLRMLRPVWVDAEGASGEASVDVVGCQVDRDPRSPWDRPVTLPGAERCIVEVDWSASASRMQLPVVIDPAWTTAATMSTPRVHHSASAIDGGARVLVAGGSAQHPPVAMASAEIYDVTTRTFAQTSAMSVARAFHTSTLLNSGRVLVTGGSPGYPGTGDMASAERYDPMTGVWQPTGLMNLGRTGHRAVLLASGRVLAFGYYHNPNGDPLSERYDPALDTWQVVSGQPFAWRRNPSLLRLDGGRVMVLGGEMEVGMPLQSVEVYDEITDAWAPSNSMNRARTRFDAVVLEDGRVLAAAGCDSPCPAEIWDGSGWVDTGQPPHTRNTSLVLLDDGQALLVGASTTPGPLASLTAAYDPNAGTWAQLSDLIQGRSEAALVALPGVEALVIGGYFDMSSPSGVSDNVEHFSKAALGASCQAATECLSGFCSADGICCSTACDGVCMACALALTGEADGTCAPVLEDTDPMDQCTGTVDSACQVPARCDGSGACQVQPPGDCQGVSCQSGNACRSGSCSDGFCCDRRCDGLCETCAGAISFEDRGTCQLWQEGNDPDGDCDADPDDPCGPPGHCDGHGACVLVAPQGWQCGETACVEGDVQTFACDGAGQCLTTVEDCAPFVCDGHQCLTECRNDGACDADYICRARQCVPRPVCINETQRQWEDGEVDECSPGRCIDGACVKVCRSSVECARGARCDAEGECRFPDSDDLLSFRCGCRVPGGSTEGSWGWVWIAGVGVWLGRRRWSR